jgi:hypothetical protein
MTVLNIFQFNSYREVIKNSLLHNKAQRGQEFTFDKMAQACRLQRTYLSAVLGGKGHLNSDQLYMACEFLRLREPEYRFTSHLHELERSVFPSRCKMLQREIEALRAKEQATEAYIEDTPVHAVNTPGLIDFYLDFNAQLIHMFLTLEHFKRDPARIRVALGLDAEVFNKALAHIEKAGLVRRTGNSIEMLKVDFHLPATSVLFPTYRNQMRLKAMEFMQTHSRESQYSFSVLFSTDDAVRRRIQARFLEFIDWAQKQATEGEQTAVCQMNFDLLRWGQCP